jgi:hypothetical protein
MHATLSLERPSNERLNESDKEGRRPRPSPRGPDADFTNKARVARGRHLPNDESTRLWTTTENRLGALIVRGCAQL